jgi:hypothetical protein
MVTAGDIVNMMRQSGQKSLVSAAASVQKTYGVFENLQGGSIVLTSGSMKSSSGYSTSIGVGEAPSVKEAITPSTVVSSAAQPAVAEFASSGSSGSSIPWGTIALLGGAAIVLYGLLKKK